nr:thioether cross-link-forming SCIFF peptide maturase [uncultured Solibaculum sp.]
MIHQFIQNGYHIALDVNSGAVHVLDELSYHVLEKVEPPMDKQCPPAVVDALKGTYPVEEIKEAYGELYQLYEADMLFSEDDYAPFADKMVVSPIKAMCLHVAHDCNLRCEYCFAAKGDFGGERKLMPLEVGKKAIDFLIERSGSRRNLELDFFGGEPLMNFDVVKQVVAYARSKEKEYNKNFRFTITTNGILLTDDKIEFINREMSNVVLSIDGRQEVNDRLRFRVDGSGSYDSILPKFQKLVQTRGDKDYYARGTFTRHNLDFSEDVMHLHDVGFDQVSVEPVVSDPKLPYAITEEDLPKVFDEYDRLALRLLDARKKGEGFNFFHFMLDLDQGPCAIKRLRGCGCGNEYVAVTPEGDIYPCHQFVGMEDWKMGSVLDNSVDMDAKARFAKANIYGKTDCGDCWAKFYCSGGCNANNLQYAGDILKPHKLSCELEKKRLECAIMMKAALLDQCQK